VRTERIIQRIQEKKTMKNRIKNLRIAARVAFKAGKESVLLAAHGLSYGEGYEVTGQDLVDGNGTVADVSVPVVSDELAAPKPSIPLIIPA
jgi:hypothetical protein